MEKYDLDNEKCASEKLKWKYLFRQLVICSGSWNCYFMLGFCMGSPTVLVPQLRRENHTVSEDMASWLPAAISYCGMPWVFILPALALFIGRKKSHYLVSFTTFVGYSIFYFSSSVPQILISEIFQGPLAASYLTTAVVAITEYTSAEYRGLFLTLKSASMFWGLVIANVVGTFCHWRYLAAVGLVCSMYNLITTFFWPESPYWLAGRGRFKECAASHRWLKGMSDSSEQELEKIITSHEGVGVRKSKIKSILKTIKSKVFWKPVGLAILLTCLYCFSGKMICSVFAIDILKKVTSEHAAYTGMLVLDGVSVASMYTGCFISKFMRRRVMLLSFSAVGVGFLLSMALYLILVANSLVTDNTYVAIFLLGGYSIAISCGPMTLSTSIIGELLPTESKSLSMCVIALVFKSVFGTFLKISPYCFRYLKMYGTFLLFCGLTVICLVLIYFYVPETKDKTLLEIDEAIKNVGVKNTDEFSELMPKKSRNKSIIVIRK